MRKTFKSRFDRSDVVLQVPTRYLQVGTCGNRFSGVARFEPSEVIYCFDHPQHRQVEMHMRYKDMEGVSADGPELRFRVVNVLSYFTPEYDPSNSAHDLRIGFEKESDLYAFREKVLPLMLQVSGHTT